MPTIHKIKKRFFKHGAHRHAISDSDMDIVWAYLVARRQAVPTETDREFRYLWIKENWLRTANKGGGAGGGGAGGINNNNKWALTTVEQEKLDGYLAKYPPTEVAPSVMADEASVAGPTAVVGGGKSTWLSSSPVAATATAANNSGGAGAADDRAAASAAVSVHDVEMTNAPHAESRQTATNANARTGLGRGGQDGPSRPWSAAQTQRGHQRLHLAGKSASATAPAIGLAPVASAVAANSSGPVGDGAGGGNESANVDSNARPFATGVGAGAGPKVVYPTLPPSTFHITTQSDAAASTAPAPASAAAPRPRPPRHHLLDTLAQQQQEQEFSNPFDLTASGALSNTMAGPPPRDQNTWTTRRRGTQEAAKDLPNEQRLHFWGDEVDDGDDGDFDDEYDNDGMVERLVRGRSGDNGRFQSRHHAEQPAETATAAAPTETRTANVLPPENQQQQQQQQQQQKQQEHHHREASSSSFQSSPTQDADMVSQLMRSVDQERKYKMYYQWYKTRSKKLRRQMKLDNITGGGQLGAASASASAAAAGASASASSGGGAGTRVVSRGRDRSGHHVSGSSEQGRGV